MGGGVPGNRDVDLNLTTKEVTGQNAPVGAVLVAQAMSGDDASMRYKGMQAVKDWDRTRLGYRAVKRVFDIVFSGCVLAVIAIPSLVLAAAIRLESEGNPFYSPPRRQPVHLPHVEVPLHVQGRRRASRRAQGAKRDRRRHVQDEGRPARHQDRQVHP